MSDSAVDARYRAALDFLYGRIDYERGTAMPYGKREFRLDRMSRLLAELGDPLARLPIVHVAGTKGKGSTAAMTSSVLAAADLHCGLFSSPHLHRIEERIAIDGQACSTEEFAELAERVRPLALAMDAHNVDAPREGGPTFFELTTAMAIDHFVRRGVDLAVLEVGLGGRLDSTNVCLPRVSVITSISYDHTQLLGETLADIAGEKAGIVKPGIPVISGVTDEEPREVIERVCRQQGSPLVQLGVDFDFTYHPPRLLDRQATRGEMDFNVSHKTKLGGLQLGLIGRHQAANAALVVAIIDELRRQGWRISDEAIRRGLADVPWPARVEVVGRSPTVVIDAAHNTASIAALLATLDESFSADRRTLIFATTQDKDTLGMLRLLAPRFDRIVLTQYRSNPRFVPLDQLVRLAQQAGCQPHGVYATPEEAWLAVRGELRPHDLLCATGSFFLAAEIGDAIAKYPAR